MAKSIRYTEVYIEGVPLSGAAIQPVETAVPVFIGYTEKASDTVDSYLTFIPQRITSLLEYENLFGRAEKEKGIEVTLTDEVDAWGKVLKVSATAAFAAPGPSRHNLYNALQLFYANGGGPCYIISVDTYQDTPFGERLPPAAFEQALQVLSTFAEPTLVLLPEGVHMDTAAHYYSLQNAILAQCASLKNRFAIVDLYEAGTSINEALENFRNGIGADHLSYGAAYFPNLVTTLKPTYEEAEVTIRHIRTCNGVLTSNAPFDQCRLNDERLKQNGYYERAIKAIETLSVIIPPGPAVAGVYAQVDRSRGVWKAPANVSLEGVKATEVSLLDTDQDQMSVDPIGGKSVNAIRTFAEKGILVWGARTLAGNDNEWRYVPVRRFWNMVEAAVQQGTAPFVTEPNEAGTWLKVRAAVEDFLLTLWKQGALRGAKPDQAFFVRVGLGQTMTEQDIQDKKMIIEMGLAILRPAEFNLLRITQQMNA